MLIAQCLFAVATFAAPPNFVVLLADDLGYGDLGCFGHPTIRTPNLDRLANEGVRFTQFYSGEPVCTPTRAALLTGRWPVRTGLCDDNRRVLFPDSAGGLPPSEITIAETLKPAGYACACVGKWHLGHLKQFLPTKQGFDRYFGIPYSNDMGPGRRGYPPVPLIRDEAIIEKSPDQRLLTGRYTDEAIAFIKENRDRPFFLYLPYTFPHVPLFASDTYRGKSPRGLYGDVVEELDGSVGRIIATLRDLKLDERTIVFFTSDNGPWIQQKLAGGSAGLLRDGKGSTFEGGMRVPTIAWGPGRVPAGRVSLELGSVVDLLPTLAAFAEVKSPTDRPIDGVDLSAAWMGKGPSPRKVMPYWRGTHLMAVRKGPWKAHFETQAGYGRDMAITRHQPPLLYQLHEDPSEAIDRAADFPEVVRELTEERDRQIRGTPASPSQLAATIPPLD